MSYDIDINLLESYIALTKLKLNILEKWLSDGGQEFALQKLNEIKEETDIALERVQYWTSNKTHTKPKLTLVKCEVK